MVLGVRPRALPDVDLSSHELEVDWDGDMVRCRCGVFDGTVTFVEHLTLALSGRADPPRARRHHDPTDHDCRGGVSGDRFPL